MRRIALGVSVLLLLSGCATLSNSAEEAPAPTPVSEPPVAESPSPTPTVPPAIVATIPTDCLDLVSADVYASTFGETPLNDPAVVGERPASGDVQPLSPEEAATDVYTPIEAGAELACTWRDPAADITYLEAIVAVVEPAAWEDYFDNLALAGYTCEGARNGRQCQKVGQNRDYPVTEAFTFFGRDDVVVSVAQANFPTNDLMGAITERIWATG